MNSVLIGLMLTIGLSTFANTTESVYEKDSVLPTELKAKVLTEYETVFTSRYYFDGMHPSTQEIKVVSSKGRYHTGKVYTTIHQLIVQNGCEQEQ